MALAIRLRNRLPQPMTCLFTPLTNRICHHLTRLTAQGDPNPEVVRFFEYKRAIRSSSSSVVEVGSSGSGANRVVGDERPFEGKHCRIERPLNLPQSLSRPHPPILIAGSGEHKTLRLVARYADACNLQPGPQKLEILRQHCEAEGRDDSAIEKTCMFAFDAGEYGSKVSELIGQLRWLAGMGIQTVLGVVPHVYRIEPLEIIGREVIPAVADL
jgi:alkanesulfonate monooxygenase SsuD/methylene tetrahydromethanopterin reductase-like flavin-dependent oxidoreductase (luciferase family)